MNLTTGNTVENEEDGSGVYEYFNRTSGNISTISYDRLDTQPGICSAQMFYTVGSFMGILSIILLLLAIVYMHRKYKALWRMSAAVAPLGPNQTGVTLEGIATNG